MAWKETERAAATMIRRRYQCDVCGHVFEDRVASAEAALPDCPKCPKPARAGAPLPGTGLTWQAPMPGLLTTKAKAIDYTQKMAEEVYGLTDMNDNQRAGDIAYKGPPPMSTSEQEAAIRAMVEASAQIAQPIPPGPLLADGRRGIVAEENRHLLVDPNAQVANFFQGNQGSTGTTIAGDGTAAKMASQQAKAMGVDPVGILEQGRASGSMPFKVDAVGVENNIPDALKAGQAATAANPQRMPKAV